MTGNDYLMLEAGVNAISLSGLARWVGEPGPVFEAIDQEAFEKSLSLELGWYGRWLRWSWFAIGAETIAKAACLANTHRCPEFNDIKKSRRDYLPRLELVDSNLAGWAKAYRKDGRAQIFQQSVDVCSYDNYGLLGDYWKKHLPTLGGTCGLSSEKIDILCAGYRLLATAIRNRDVHNYVLGVRQENFHLVRSVFVPSFNVLLETFSQQELTKVEAPRHGDPT